MVGVLVISFFLAVSVQAKQKQQPLPQPLTADDIVAKLKTQLGLTGKQVDEIKPIIENYLAQEQQLKLQEKKQLSKVLTADQLYSWEDLQKQVQREKKKHIK